MTQKRYKSEEEIIAFIDRLRALEAKDYLNVEHRKAEIKKLAPFGESSTINHHKAMILEAEARIKRRGIRLGRMKEKLAEFRTIVLPGMSEVMTDASIVR